MPAPARHFLLALAAGLALFAVAAQAAAPAGWQFTSVRDKVNTLGSSGMFATSYADQQLSIGTHLNANGSLTGFWLKQSGEFHTYSLRFASNPAMQVLDTPNFIGLTGSDITCVWIFCSIDMAYGIRVIPSVDPTLAATGITAFVNTPTGGSAVAGSLPLTVYPGNFVDENRKGIVASTQVTADAQFGVIVYPGGMATLADIPWFVAINDLAEPLVLAYDGVEANCLVYGTDCAPPPECADGDTGDTHEHGNGGDNGQGHVEHGNGWGYGHDKCSDGDSDGDVGRGNNESGGGVVPTDVGNGSLLVRLRADGTAVRYRMPSTVAIDGALLSHAFPLALNNTRAIMRGTVTVNGTTLANRLLSCAFDPANIDTNADSVVDCTGGITLIGGTGGSIAADTVLGFTLNANDLLAGNYGYNAAGIGAPFVVDLAAATPTAVALVNVANNTEGWEINEVTDLNPGAMLTGYGYRDCARSPQAFLATALSAANGSRLQFQRSAFESPALLAAGESLLVAPVVTGATGNVELRTWVKTPDESAWRLLQDWSTNTPLYEPAGYTGEVCFKVQARDTASPAAIRQEVVRYLVGVAPSGGTIGTTPDLAGIVSQLFGGAGTDPAGLADLAADASGSAPVAEPLGAFGGLLLLTLLPLALRRRR